jgi:hypothetical protein
MGSPMFTNKDLVFVNKDGIQREQSFNYGGLNAVT